MTRTLSILVTLLPFFGASCASVGTEPNDLASPSPDARTTEAAQADESISVASATDQALPNASAVGHGSTRRAPLLDANGNGIEDAIDIASGLARDDDANGVPDDAACPPGVE